MAAAGAAAGAGAETSTEFVAGSLLGKVVSLGKSAWALAVAHPVIATVAVAATIAIPIAFIAYRRRRTNNVIIPHTGEVPQVDEPQVDEPHTGEVPQSDAPQINEPQVDEPDDAS
jgi:uncharacterized membrane protein YebE (DUF533 family)